MVRGNFPRVTRAALVDGVPAGVEQVEYEINVGAFGHLRLAKSPEDEFSL